MERIIHYLYAPIHDNGADWYNCGYDESEATDDCEKVMYDVIARKKHYAILEPLSLAYLGELYI